MKTRTKFRAGGSGGIQLPPASNDSRTVSRFHSTFRVTDQNARDTRKEHI